MNTILNKNKHYIDEQNRLVNNFSINKLRKTPFAISRDKQSRIIILYGNDKYPIITAGVLGINRAKRPIVKDIGNLTYSPLSEDSLFIDNVYVDSRYFGNDIDQILLQSFQNFALDSGIKTIETAIVPSQQMLEDFSAPPSQFDTPYVDPLLLTFISNNYKRIFPFGTSYLKANKFIDSKYFLSNSTLKPTNVSYGTTPLTSKSKVLRQFKPFNITPYVSPKAITEREQSNFTPLSIYPTSQYTSYLADLLGETLENEHVKR